MGVVLRTHLLISAACGFVPLKRSGVFLNQLRFYSYWLPVETLEGSYECISIMDYITAYLLSAQNIIESVYLMAASYGTLSTTNTLERTDWQVRANHPS
jgi:hypothetical protein